ncbi:MAG: dihydrofolate reductase family protein [Armatimonadota bacterium]
MTKVPSLNYDQVVRAFRRDGWVVVRQRGSHIHENVAEEVKKLKQQVGRDMMIFGGVNLVQSFTNPGFIDEYRLLVDPVLLAGGKSLFENIDQRLKLGLLDTKRYKSGTVVLHYQIRNGQAG